MEAMHVNKITWREMLQTTRFLPFALDKFFNYQINISLEGNINLLIGLGKVETFVIKTNQYWYTELKKLKPILFLLMKIMKVKGKLCRLSFTVLFLEKCEHSQVSCYCSLLSLYHFVLSVCQQAPVSLGMMWLIISPDITTLVFIDEIRARQTQDK